MKRTVEWLAAMDRWRPGESVSVAHRRIIVPGENGYELEGHLRFQPVCGIQRPGLSPEVMSLVSWIVPSETAEIFSQSDQAQEWAGAISILLNRRIEVLNEIPMGITGNDVLTFLPAAGSVDSSLIAPVDLSALDQPLTEMLSRCFSLSSGDLDVISSAIQLHHSASLLFTDEINTAYTLAVAGIEVLSRRFGSPPDDWQSWDGSEKWDQKLVELQLTDAQAQGIRLELMKDRQLRLKRTYVQYVLDSIPMDFWREPLSEWINGVDEKTGRFSGGTWNQNSRPRLLWEVLDEKEIEKGVKESYNVRNGYVHSGRRPVSLISDLAARLGKSVRPLLPFEAVRSALRFLVLKEIESRSTLRDITRAEYRFARSENVGGQSE